MFSKDKVNSGRQLELDIARGLAVLFMILIHTQLFFATMEVQESTFGAFNDFVGMVPAAPMFMFLLGVGINYTRKSEPKTFFKMGSVLILMGYVLNILKGFVPCIIKAYRYMDIGYMYEGIAELAYVDILQFSGLAMIMFGFFKLIKANNFIVISYAALFAGLNILLHNVQIDNIFLSSITGLIWGSSEYSYFPFLTWIIYPIVGFIFGSYLIRCEDKKKFYRIILILSIITLVYGTYIFTYYLDIPNGMITDTNYYHHIITDNITFTAIVMLEIALISFITQYIPKFLGKIISRWSKNVTAIFFIHWIIITWTALFIPANSLNMFGFLLLIILIIVLSDFLSYIYSSRKIKKI